MYRLSLLIITGFLWLQMSNAFSASSPKTSSAVSQQNNSVPEWIRPSKSNDKAIWGIRGGLHWAIQPDGFRRGEPRGLIRIAYPVLTNGVYDLINFIAVEPIVQGRKGFSELEFSALDKKPGKRLWAINDKKEASVNSVGKLSVIGSGVEQLETKIAVEPFENGAKVHVVISQRNDAPNEIKLTVHAAPDSAPIEYCILTATMGNMARTRELHLKDEIVSSLKLYPNHRGDDFAPHTIFPLERLLQNASGDVIAPFSNDEKDPASAYPYPGSQRWHYGGVKVTQYWKKAHGTFRDDLHVAVNARYTYWKSKTPLPGGVAFENFEMREKFYDGQEFIFGITTNEPAQLFAEKR